MTTREEFIAALRELAEFLADHPDVRTPTYGCDISVIPTGSDESKLAAIDAIAASLDVKAYVDGDAYECSRRFGPINYRAHAHTQAVMQDWSDTLQLGAEALAARKATSAARAVHYDQGDATSWGYKDGTRKTPCGYESAADVVSRVEAVTCETCKVEIAQWSEAAR